MCIILKFPSTKSLAARQPSDWLGSSQIKLHRCLMPACIAMAFAEISVPDQIGRNVAQHVMMLFVAGGTGSGKYAIQSFCIRSERMAKF